MAAAAGTVLEQRLPLEPAVVPIVVQQHLDDAIVLHATRTSLLRAPHVQLRHLKRFDDRLAAHLDGLRIAGDYSWSLCRAALESGSPSVMFVAAVRAIEDDRSDRLEPLMVLTQSAAETGQGLLSAFGWLEREHLRGVVSALLASKDPAQRYVGVAASALHRVDPALIAARRLEDPDPMVRGRSLRTAGELGKCEMVSVLTSTLLDEDARCRFWGAWSAVLLGDRMNALDYLRALAQEDGPLQPQALQLAVQTLPVAEAHALLQQIAQVPANVRKLIQGAGLSGDPSYVPWLIGQMADDKLARFAGDAFSMITGVDLALLDLERPPPESVEAGPNDDPADPNVDMDADDGLPWPDPSRVQAWWAQRGSKFGAGVRHFVGGPVTRAHCMEVLKTGYQRQRIAAAFHLCLLNPGTPLFEWRAPARRQQRELAQMA